MRGSGHADLLHYPRNPEGIGELMRPTLLCNGFLACILFGEGKQVETTTGSSLGHFQGRVKPCEGRRAFGRLQPRVKVTWS